MMQKETYSLEWVGKKYAKTLTNEPVKTFIKWDKNNENLLIKGDNLEVLKHIVNIYHKKIKMIYIDPPYNTGNVIVYNDKFKKENDKHSAWLTFMYPRLYIARKLLKDDGVIFISIDDNEVAQLKLLMDEIFGEENYIGNFIRKTRTTMGYVKSGVNKQHEYTLCYAKNKKNIYFKGEKKDLSNYKNPDNDPNGEWVSGSCTVKDTQGNNTFFPIRNPYTKKITFPPEGRTWIFNKKTFEKYIKSGKIIFKRAYSEGERGFIFKRYKKELKSKFKLVDTLFAVDNKYLNQVGTREIINKFGYDIFIFPKPSTFIKKLIKFTTENDDIILDFFAGSGTTGVAVNELNNEDGGKRKFILIQLEEKIKNNKRIYNNLKKILNSNNPTIYDICKERLIRENIKFTELTLKTEV